MNNNNLNESDEAYFDVAVLNEYIEFLKRYLKEPELHDFDNKELYKQDIDEALREGHDHLEVSPFETKSGNPEVFYFSHLMS
jgi:hypothetical protein